MLGKDYRKHIERNWEDVRKENLPDALHVLREKIHKMIQDLTLCAKLEPENHLVPRSLPNVLGEDAVRPFLEALLDQGPHEKSKRVESKEDRAARRQRERRLGALLVEIGARECLRWGREGQGSAIADSACQDARRGAAILIELGRGPET
jgi:hypothetical protein